MRTGLYFDGRSIGFLGGFEVFEVVYGKKRRELFLPSPGATD